MGGRRPSRRGAGIVLAGLVLGAGIAWAAVAPATHRGRDGRDLVARGAYLARAGDCMSCHTRAGGEPLAGGRAIPTPFGTLYSPNITPDRETGIGNWSAADFRRAMHEGIDADGHALYPAFPYTSYTRVTRRDLDAIWAWLRTVPAVHRADTPHRMRFPFGWRALLAGWRALYFDAGEFTPPANRSEAYRRGAYLVEGLGHCGECHTPRNRFGATEDDRELRGGMIPVQDWYAPDLGTAEGNGLHGWTRRDIVDFLKHGRSSRGMAYGPMAEVVRNSTQYLDDADLEAIATYLLEHPSLPSKHTARRFQPDAAVAAGKRRLDRHVASGREIYRHHCADCHGRDGRGKPNVYPALAGNTSLLAAEPVNAIRAVLLGGFAPATEAWPRPYSMPPFIQRLDDAEVADVVTYIRHAWGNRPQGGQTDAVVRRQTVGRYRSTFTHRQ